MVELSSIRLVYKYAAEVPVGIRTKKISDLWFKMFSEGSAIDFQSEVRIKISNLFFRWSFINSEK